MIRLNDKAIAVEVDSSLPPGMDNFSMYCEVNKILDHKSLPEGNWQILGLAHELNEEQCAHIVRTHIGFFSKKPWYRNYMDDQDIRDDEGADIEVNSFSSAKESFQSLMESHGLVFENPFGNKISPLCSADEWREAQKKVKTYLILVKS